MLHGMSEGDPHSKPPCRRDDALAIVQRLRASGHIAYFAGGAVRDLLLGLEPKDYDVATDARPERVRSLFANTQAVGQAFGVILVRLGRSVVEVATFRSDGRYTDGRRPDTVQFSTAEEDARRRDFTINGLFMDPLDGQVIDYVGGSADLAARVVRAIGDPEARFEEDHLRLLRAVRFAARFDFAIESSTQQAVRRHAPELARISPERVGEELRIILTPPMRVRAWRDLRQTGLADVIFRFMPAFGTPGVPVVMRESHLFDALLPEQGAPFGLALATATLDRVYSEEPDLDLRVLFQKGNAQKIARAFRQALRISNEEWDQVVGTLEGLAPLVADPTPGVAAMKRFLARPSAASSRALLAAVRGVLDQRRATWVEARLAELEQGEFAPPPLITGDDLTAVGLAAGPKFKRVLEAVYDAQLEGRVRSKEEAMSLAIQFHKA